MSRVAKAASRLSAELAVIVLGVLIALWADGLVDARTERSDLRSHLSAVRDELRGEAETLGRLDARLESEASALRALAAIGVSGELPPDPELIDLVYAGVLDVTVYEPSMSALDDLQTSGLVPLIGDLELRLGLSRLRQAIRTAASHAEVNRSGPQQQLFDPFVLEELPFVWRSLPAIQDAAPWSGGDMSWGPLFNDRGQAMVTMRFDLVLATQEDWGGLREEIERLSELIDRELGSG